MRFSPTEPGEFTDSEFHTSRIDHVKAQIDVLKHIATLDTAALLVTFSLLEKVFKHPVHTYLVGVAAVLFLLSLAASGFACLTALAAFPRKRGMRLDKGAQRERLQAMVATFLGLLFGLLALAAFFLLNWFR